jgi:alkylation response protein AidB-like acyl-CoA dehydrogenase
MLIVVASSDATNLKNTTAVVNGEKITLSGHKWVSSFSRSLPFLLLHAPSHYRTKRIGK